MKTIWIILLSACVGALGCMMLMRLCKIQDVVTPEIEIVRDTIEMVYIDTVRIEKPLPYQVVIRDTVVLTDTLNEGGYYYETKIYKDSALTAQVSGINATLDWYEVYRPTEVNYISNTVYVPPGKWSVGIQAGVGMTPKGVQPYVGVGVAYRLELKDMFKNLKRAK